MNRAIVALAAVGAALALTPAPAALADPPAVAAAATTTSAATPAPTPTNAPTAHTAATDPVRAAQWYLSSLGIRWAWQFTQGAGVTVCVVDSGIDTGAQDLTGQVIAVKRFTQYVNNEGIVTPHGTGVAAILAGHGHGTGGSAGVIGVAPKAKILSAVVDDDVDFDKQAGPAIRWCVDNGAKVINMSFAETADDGMGAAVAYAEQKNVVLVAASGNTFENLHGKPLYYPAKLPGVLAVTGVDKNLQHDAGALTSADGKPVSLSGPFSTNDGSSGNGNPGLPAAQDRANAAQGKPYDLDAVGTSYASPVVAGVAALIRSINPRLSAYAVVRMLQSTATAAGGAVPNRTYGSGIVNAARAVAAARPAPAKATAGIPTGTLAPGGSTEPRTTTSASATAHDSSDSSITTWSVAGGALLLAIAAAVAWRRGGRRARR